MGHRHLFNTSQMFETDNDQGWNQTQQPYTHIARSGAPESGPLVYAADNMEIDGGNCPQCNHTSDTSGQSYSVLHVEASHHQQQDRGPARVLQPAAGSFFMTPESYADHASSSNNLGHAFPGVVAGGVYDPAIGSGRGPYKRKSPSIPTINEQGSTSRYFDAGSSSDRHIASDLWEKHDIDYHHNSWVCPPGYGGHSHSVSGENTLRNVRSRAAHDSGGNPSRARMPSNPAHQPFTGPITYLPSPVNLLSQSHNTSAWGWNHVSLPPGQERAFATDGGLFNHEMNHLNAANTNPSSSLEIGVYHSDFNHCGNSVPHSLQHSSNQFVRGGRSNYIRRSSPASRVSSSTIYSGHVATSDEGLHLGTGSHSSRYPPHSTIGRTGRTRMPTDRYRSFCADLGHRDRFTPEGLLIAERSTFYGSRSLIDQHRDMRLDIDNMSYEELLALGERIGHVNTGLSNELIPKCLTQSIYCSSEQSQEEGSCVICLEEYKNMDDVGTLKVCGHDFHVGCVRKWLSIKNSCPICKASALGDKAKE